jgi:thiamine transport system ATP-binding protein
MAAASARRRVAVTPRVEVSSARVAFGATRALDGVDLAVDAGEVVAVLGPSGSGKSTLLRAIAGLQPLDTGRVAIDGAEVTGTPPHERGVGMMFQQPALFPHLDVAANVAFGLRMRGDRGADVGRRVADLLELVGLPGTERRDPATLSGGEQQRVALARALAPAPRVLLLDEPFGSLDRPRRDQLVTELRSLFARLALTVVAVTHDQREAFAMAGRLVLLDRGRVEQEGPAADVWRAPATARAAALLGFRNVVEVEVAHGRAGSPWGDLGPAPAGARHAVIRPEAVVLDPSGLLEGRVASTVFAGAHATVVVEVDDGPPLDAEVPTLQAPAPGSVVRLRLDPAGISLLPRP